MVDSCPARTRTSRRNAEAEALEEQVASLQSQLDTKRQKPDSLVLAEEQYKLVRKYLGSGTAMDEDAEPTKYRRDSRLSVMRSVRESEVEALTLAPQGGGVERNLGFLTAAGAAAHADTPTVRVCVTETQVIRDESTVAAATAGNRAYRRYGHLAIGHTAISGMRLQVTALPVEYSERLFDFKAGVERPELPQANDSQRGVGIRRAKCRNECKHHSFAKVHDLRRQGTFTGNHREKRRPTSNSGDRQKRTFKCK